MLSNLKNIPKNWNISTLLLQYDIKEYIKLCDLTINRVLFWKLFEYKIQFDDKVTRGLCKKKFLFYPLRSISSFVSFA